ncbi:MULTISPECIES: hypothetical protein [unclassified Pseudomonas]|uniref:hypothetical protein n=1 Tax=unclassified Pseudomonas TaxID=196821 RepID=UPI001B33DA18|nr:MULTISPECIES: hypothetical protein [unclassified Pseudomonas]MBP5947439.1 hypothetical protein [Pseudomonas sp. P9(2020)]MBZ9565592.1 hypothetical protein [Pseudomonas sp. P116]
MSELKGSESKVAAANSNEAGVVTGNVEVDKNLPHRFGDFGGALSWPMPLSVLQKNNLRLAASHYLNGLDDFGTAGFGVLDYLNSDLQLSDKALGDTPSALEKLITGARGQALGLAVQNRLNGIATDVSVNEYAMAGIQLVLHQGGLEDPQRNTVAGFDIADQKHWGKPVSAIFNNLVEYLVKAHLSSRRMARLTANLLLVWKAPALLISDLPDHLKYGSAAWLNLAVAAQTIEAQTPGKVACMTFAQVMNSAESAAQADPDVTLQAQAAALVDWGIVNGSLEKRSDDLYSTTQLEDVKTHFNDQLADRLNASILLRSQFPSRKEIALTKLKERFKGYVPFEEKLLDKEPMSGRTTVPSGGGKGTYSLLDIAMTESSRYTLWRTSDSRLRPHRTTINKLHDLRVPEIFQAEFDSTLSKLKEGVRLTIRHLISELPLEDRRNLEYGIVTFFQSKNYKSDGHWRTSLQSTDPELIVKTELGADTQFYTIDLHGGAIKRKEFTRELPAAKWSYPDSPSFVYAIESFEFSDGLVGVKRWVKTATLSLTPTSYSSVRTRMIADAFVQHLDLDNEAVLKEAKGVTTLEQEHAVAMKVVDFVLNLIPFKSAITNFINGKYVEGAIDLFLDVLGFVTAGASAAAKLAKIGAKTASAIGKALKAAKIIGAVIIGELNPLSGVLAGVQQVGKGVKFVGKMAVHQLNKIRGASGGYDLLVAAGKEFGPTVLGTFKVGEKSIDGVGVLKNGNWYHYNAYINKPYGLPHEFQPKLFGQGRIFGPSVDSALYHERFYNNLISARKPQNLSSYQRGFNNGLLEGISDYSPSLDLDELYELASNPKLLPEQIGALTKEIKRKTLDSSYYATNLLLQDVPTKFTKVTPMSQAYYIAYVDLASKGECAGLSSAMAVAMAQGKEDVLLQNLYKAAHKPDIPQANKFIHDLRNFQDKVNKKSNFHLNATLEVMTVNEIVNTLLSSPHSKTLMLSTKDHGMVAGIRVTDGNPQWFFYDPNSGLAKLESIAAMQETFVKVLENGALASSHNTFRSTRGGRVYEVSEFNINNIDASYIEHVKELSSIELPDLPDELLSIQVMI